MTQELTMEEASFIEQVFMESSGNLYCDVDMLDVADDVGLSHHDAAKLMQRLHELGVLIVWQAAEGQDHGQHRRIREPATRPRAVANWPIPRRHAPLTRRVNQLAP